MTSKKLERESLRASQIDRAMWFKNAVEESMLDSVDADTLHGMICKYISRFDNERERLVSSSMKTRPKPQKVQLLESIKSSELKEYENGFLVPNLLLHPTLVALKQWTGDYSVFRSIKSIRLKKVEASS